MLAMTLETDCVLTVLGLLDRQAELEDAAALELLGRSAQEGAVSLWASYSADEAVAAKRDLPWSDALTETVLPEWLSHLPRFGASVTAQDASGIWWSKYGYPPVRVNDALSETLRKLERMIYGQAGPFSSVVELLEHRQQGTDWFITLDRRTLLTKHGRDNLKRHWDIRTCSPVEAVGLICLDKGVAAHD
jgi:hypothetical protein